MEFDDDGNPIGPHSSLYAFFLGQQVRNRSVCPIQVKEWEEYKPETLDHLWACIKVTHFLKYMCVYVLVKLLSEFLTLKVHISLCIRRSVHLMILSIERKVC